MRTKKLKSPPVGVIGKVLRILELLDRHRSGLSLKDISEETSLNKSTAHRFLTHLEAEGYLFRDAIGNYMLGPKIMRMGSGVSFQATLCKMSRPYLEEVWKTTGETVNLAVLDGTDVLYLDVIESLNTFRLATEVGMRRPVHCTSLGKAMLASLSDLEQKKDILKAIQFSPVTPKSATSRIRLENQLRTIAELGYSLDDEEAVSGARCIGAAILDGEGNVVAGISVSGPVVRITKAHLPAFSAIICSAAQKISKKLGYQGAMVGGLDPVAIAAPVESKKRRAVAQRSKK